MEKLLLHSCCGPCSTAVIEKLADKYEVTVYYFNPNIYPQEEYNKRLSEQKRFLKEKYGDKITLIDGKWNCETFKALARGHEDDKEGGARCELCFKMRLEGTCKYALEHGYDCFTTTLSVSPYKNAVLLNKIGNEFASIYNINFVESNFKKQNGFVRSVKISKQYNLYRQNYCGCEFSLRNSIIE